MSLLVCTDAVSLNVLKLGMGHIPWSRWCTLKSLLCCTWSSQERLQLLHKLVICVHCCCTSCWQELLM